MLDTVWCMLCSMWLVPRTVVHEQCRGNLQAMQVCHL